MNEHISAKEKNITQLIFKKKALYKLYLKYYEKFNDSLQSCPDKGLILELGSGCGFAKKVIPKIITTDVLPYKAVDMHVDAMNMPFEDSSLKAILMINTLHHISNVELFFSEASRCLVPGGKIFIIDQYIGTFSYWIYKYLHKEYFDSLAQEWNFNLNKSCLSENGALTWIIFYRDFEQFKLKYPELKVFNTEKHTAFTYWLTGGLKKWSILPGFTFSLVNRLDDFITKLFPGTSSFVDIELIKKI